MTYTAQIGATLNVEGSFNQFFTTQLTARGLPDFMPSAVVNYDYPRQPLTYPSFSVTHFAAMPVQRFEGHQLDPGFKGAEFEGIAQIDCWESYQRASGNDKYNIRVMADMAQRVYATGAAIQILNIYAATANPSANGTMIRMNQAESMGLVSDPNPDITHWSLRVPYRWMARNADVGGAEYLYSVNGTYSVVNLEGAWRNRIVMIGDSIMAGVGSQTAAPASWLQWQIGEGAYVLNKGIGGNNLTDVINRLNTDVIAYHPGVCVLEVGTNDLGGSDDPLLAKMKTITTTLLDVGIIPLWCTLLPRSDIAAHRPQIRRINTWLMAHAANYGLPIADTCTEFSASDGSPKSGYLQDGLHPTTLGGKAFANVVYSALPDTARRAVPWRMLGDAENLISNPTFTTDSNSDGVPDGWFAFANGVGTFSLSAHTTEGNWFVITKAASGSAAQTGAVYTLSVTAGHTYRIAFDVDYSETGTTPGLNAYLSFTPSATTDFILLNAQVGTLSSCRPWHEFTVATGDTTAYIYVWTATTTNAAVLKIGRIRAWDVTTEL